MGEITVTSEKVNVNGRDGYIATATNGQAYTTTHRQNTAEDAERVAVRLFKDGVIDGHYHYDDMRSEDVDDGSTEQPHQTIQYHKGMARENFAQFKAAAILAVVGVGFVASLIMFIVSLLS